jgi:hypothetical protein
LAGKIPESLAARVPKFFESAPGKRGVTSGDGRVAEILKILVVNAREAI